MKRIQCLGQIIVLLATTVSFSTPVNAQDSAGQTSRSPSFKLSVERRRVSDDPAAPPLGLRISRDKLKGNVGGEPPLAPPRYQAATGAQLDPADFSLRADGAKLPGRVEKSGPLKGSAFVKALADFNVELIVDESMSMRRRDCPGGVSRWEWCGMQLNDLTTQLSPYVPHGFTLTTFASEFQSYAHSGPEDVRELFAYPEFSFGTRLSRPLKARLSNHFANRSAKSKPLLILVITDGVPAPRMEPGLVAETLIAASHRVQNPQEVTVVFFQIGGSDNRGRWFLNEMDNALVASGARHDIVRTVSFETLQSQGLTRSLVSSINNFARISSGRP